MVVRIGNHIHTFDDHADDIGVDGGVVAAEVGDCNNERDDDAAAPDADADAAEDALTGYDDAWVAVAD